MYSELPGKTKFSKNTIVSLLHFNLAGQSRYSEKNLGLVHMFYC